MNSIRLGEEFKLTNCYNSLFHAVFNYPRSFDQLRQQEPGGKH